VPDLQVHVFNRQGLAGSARELHQLMCCCQSPPSPRVQVARPDGLSAPLLVTCLSTCSVEAVTVGSDCRPLGSSGSTGGEPGAVSASSELLILFPALWELGHIDDVARKLRSFNALPPVFRCAPGLTIPAADGDRPGARPWRATRPDDQSRPPVSCAEHRCARCATALVLSRHRAGPGSLITQLPTVGGAVVPRSPPRIRAGPARSARTRPGRTLPGRPPG
jgi:hypothetical protein